MKGRETVEERNFLSSFLFKCLQKPGQSQIEIRNPEVHLSLLHGVPIDDPCLSGCPLMGSQMEAEPGLKPRSFHVGCEHPKWHLITRVPHLSTKFYSGTLCARLYQPHHSNTGCKSTLAISVLVSGRYSYQKTNHHVLIYEVLLWVTMEFQGNFSEENSI